jgi:hypothetical protein
MIVLGLLLMLACTAVAVDAVVQNTQVLQAIAFDRTVSGVSLGAIFVAGAVLGLLFALGLVMLTGGIGRASRRRRERRSVVRESAAETEALRIEKDRLARELRDERASDAYPANPMGDADQVDATTNGRHRADR